MPLGARRVPWAQRRCHLSIVLCCRDRCGRSFETLQQLKPAWPSPAQELPTPETHPGLAAAWASYHTARAILMGHSSELACIEPCCVSIPWSKRHLWCPDCLSGYHRIILKAIGQQRALWHKLTAWCTVPIPAQSALAPQRLRLTSTSTDAHDKSQHMLRLICIARSACVCMMSQRRQSVYTSPNDRNSRT
jgi:hypothetical protein